MQLTRVASFSVFSGAILAGLAMTALAEPDLAPCVSISDPAERLACYDLAANRAPDVGRPAGPPRASGATPSSVSAAASAAAVAAPQPAPAAVPPADPLADFGFSEADKRKKDPARAAAELQAIKARLTAVQQRKYGRLVVTLDNGQVWEQNEPDPSAIMRVGEEVTIKRGALGSFTLVTASKVGTKVHRLR